MYIYSCGSCEVSLQNTAHIYTHPERLDIHSSGDKTPLILILYFLDTRIGTYKSVSECI